MITGTRYRLTREINRQTDLAKDIERAMTEISTGKKIQAPSDDPVGAARVSQIARNQADMASWTRNLQAAQALASRADDALSALATGVTRAQELLTAAANGPLSDQNRATIAIELRAIAEEINAAKDTRDSRGQPLFPTGAALQIPVSEGVRVTAVGTRTSIFQVTTAGGPKDLAAIVTAAAAAIELADPTARQAAVSSSLDELEASVDHVSAVQGEQGTRGSRIDKLMERLTEFGLQAEEERSGLESADITEVVAKLQSRQLTLQAAQAAFARINASTLFDMLR